MNAEPATRAHRAAVLRLRPALDSAAAARGAIDDALPGDELHEIRFRVRLLATELVTNSVLHAGLGPEERLELRVEILADRVRVEVTDQGRWQERRAVEPPTHEPSGRGLILVGALADRWGIVKDGATKVWFEIDLAPRG